MVEFATGSVSVTGNFRENNEDRCKVDPDRRFFIVADGMGGQAAGEKASELATDIVSRKLVELIDFADAPAKEVISSIDQAIASANQQILDLSDSDPTFHNMGTTIAYVVTVGETLYVGGIGDSRVYLLRDGSLEQLTKDHSLTQALLDAGTISEEDAANHRYRNVLYRYLGTREGSTGTDTQQIKPRAGDRFMICSDGVTDGLKPDRLLELLGGDAEPQKAAEEIVQAALDGGSRDNVTCIVIHCR